MDEFAYSLDSLPVNAYNGLWALLFTVMVSSSSEAPLVSPGGDGKQVSAAVGETPQQATECAAGTRLGGYRLLVPIGAGGMAQVWAGAPEGVSLARAVALKVILPELDQVDEYERMFVDEAVTTSAIHHPNVCQVRKLARDGRRLYMVLELVLGSSLGRILRVGGDFVPLQHAIAARVASEACAGLHAAHEARGTDGESLRIVHRDVSPANILLSVNGDVKVSDFGIAKARNQLHARTKTGQIKGKFAYIPPEQIVGRRVDRRADVYALGCVLYVAALGRRPFGSGTEALGRIVRGSYCAPIELRGDFPAGLNDVIVKALQTDPDARFQTAQEMRVALEQFLAAEGQVVLSSDIGRAVKERLCDERLAVIDALMTSNVNLSDALTQRVLTPAEPLEVPTASQPPPSTSQSKSVSEEGRRSDVPTWRPNRSSNTPEVVLHIPRSPATGVGVSEAPLRDAKGDEPDSELDEQSESRERPTKPLTFD